MKRQLGEIGFAYDLDVLLHVGGSISSTDGQKKLGILFEAEEA